MMIAIRLEAGKDSIANDRRLTLVIDEHGHIHDVRPGWPGPCEKDLELGPVLEISYGEWQTQMQVATGVGL